MNPIKVFLLVFILASRFVMAQSEYQKDTLEIVRKLGYEKKNAYAISLLSADETIKATKYFHI